MRPDPKEVGRRIRLIRKEKGLTMEEFGNFIDKVNKSAVGNWERGDNLPNNARLKMIAQFAETSVNELLYGSLENFRYSVIDELFELNFIRSGMKENKPELYHYFGGEDFKNQIYDRFDNQELGYEDEEKMHEVFRNAYNSKLFGYANRKTEIAFQLDQARRELDLNLILEYFDREYNYQEYQRKRNAGEFISSNLEEKEKPVNLHLDGIKLSNHEVKLLQVTIEEIRNIRNEK
jgi:transcriptional regulator with XRE-family HTH domain